MSQKETFNGIAPYTSCDSDPVFDGKLNYNSDLPSEYKGAQSNYPDHQKSRKQYIGMDKIVNEVKPSSTYLFGKYYSPYLPRDLTKSSCNHFQDLNEKFRELECKMFEVEKCFKEANRLDIEDVDKRFKRNDFRSTSESCRDTGNNRMENRYRYTETKSAEQTSDGNDMKGWTRDQAPSNFERKYQNRMTTDGSGDTLQRSSESISVDSDKTMIRQLEKSPIHLLNRRSALTIDKKPQQDPSTQFIYDRNNKFTDVDLLEKSKKLILSLIDNELRKIEDKPDLKITSNINQVTKMTDNHRDLKLKCIQNIERELRTLKNLELLEQ